MELVLNKIKKRTKKSITWRQVRKMTDKKMKTTFSYHALICGSNVSFYFDMHSLTSSCCASASLLLEAVVHDVEVM